MQQLYGTNAHQIEQLSQFSDDDEVWQHGGTRTYYVGDVSDEEEAFSFIGTVASYRQELQDLIDAR